MCYENASYGTLPDGHTQQFILSGDQVWDKASCIAIIGKSDANARLCVKNSLVLNVIDLAGYISYCLFIVIILDVF